MYRTHAAKLNPWWFGSSLDNRFDLPDPSGTCYLAESEIVGLLEAWAGVRMISHTTVATRAISTLDIGRDLVLADVTANAAIKFGVTAEISTTIDYPLTQAWAQALHAAGFDGIRYWARHDLTHTHACIAVFDSAGDQTNSHTLTSEYVVQSSDRLLDRGDLLAEMEQSAGITVLMPPSSLGPV